MAEEKTNKIKSFFKCSSFSGGEILGIVLQIIPFIICLCTFTDKQKILWFIPRDVKISIRPELLSSLFAVIFYGILAIVLLLFYFKGKNWRKTFKEELKFRQFQTWEKILLWVVGIILMVYFFALSTIPEVTEEEFRSEIYQLMLKHYIVTGLVCFVLSITIIILIMQGNKRSFYFEKALRNHLGKFNFCGDDYQKTLDMLSGGEKMRLILSKIILRNYDMLLLDEPTNHLDMVTR